jgi:hypothetical protein
MTWFHSIISASREALEANGRAHQLAALRRMDDGGLRRNGYSPEKIALGMGAWPWLNEAGTVLDAELP